MIRARLLAFAVALELVAALTLPWLLARLLRLPEEAASSLRWAMWALVPATALGVGLQLLPRLTRRRVLELPERLTWTVLVVELLVLAGLTGRLLVGGAPAPAVIGLVLCLGALLAFSPVPLYAFSRGTVWPLAIQLGDGAVPDGRRLSLGVQLGYSIAAVAAAALVPAAVLGAARLDVAAAADAQSRARITGLRLASAAEPLEVGAATTLLTRTPLAGGERTLLRAPSGTLLPEEAASELGDLRYVEIPLAGALRGGALRVTYSARLVPRAPLLAVTLCLLLLTVAVAIGVGSALARDVESVTAQIDRVAREMEPRTQPAPTTREVRRVARACNRLLERIPRFTVESFLAIERANEAHRLKAQFLANMSHDLRSPLNSILGFSELLLRGIEGEIKAGQQVALAAIQARGLHILRLLNEILDTAKVESGKMELHRQRSSPAEILRQGVQEARRGRAHNAGDRLAVVLQPGLQPILVDPLRLTQTVTHLLNYGLDIAPTGKVILRAREEAGAFVLELEVDVALDSDERLFDGFRRGGRAGLNLALPLARRLVELHGGTLEVASRQPGRLKVGLPPRRDARAGL